MKKIAVVPNYTKDSDCKYTKQLCEYLRGRSEIFMYEKDKIDADYVNYRNDNLYEGIDAVIILGGDGTMLRAAEPCSRYAIPVMGINLGTVGFMTEVEKEDMQSACDKLLCDDFEIEERMMMKVTVQRKEATKNEYIALNDAVISKTDATMIAMELYADGDKLSEYKADGLVIATPTGSTGYSLSAGGPVADPTVSLFIATPLCAHMLSSRPMLVSDKKDICLKLKGGGEKSAVVTVDGKNKCTIGEEDTVIIQRSEYVFKIIKLGKQSFYYTMMSKL